MIRLAFLIGLLLLPLGAAAQDLASLVADRIDVDPAGRISATGNVEVFFDGARLSAAQVSYDRTGDKLTIAGPIRVTDPDGTVFLASEAELDRDLRNGVLISARMVLDQQLQIAANEIARVGDRYTRLDRVVASSCEVCFDRPVPLWEIRASRVTHDQIERQLYFENATFRVAGVPILYLPRLRLPDPTLDRATGALIPEFKTSSELGTGVKLPYFVVLGPHADVTLTPYLSSSTTTLEFGYRQEVSGGDIRALGALTDDDIDDQRGYLFADARYRLPKGFLLEAQVEFVSDPGYLFTYDYSEKDRLTNEIQLSRVREKDIFRASLTEYRTLRESEIPIRDTLPDQYLDLTYSREVPELSFGGRTVINVNSASLRRPSSADGDGRDVGRIGAGVDWSKNWIIGPGLVSRAELGLRADAYSIGQDSAYPTTATRIVPRAAAELRWPLSRGMAGGVTEVLEPVLRIDVSDTGGTSVPLEDSRVIEFDEGNLFSFSRYPGIDGVEDGVRVAAGATWRRRDANGWRVDLAFGRVASLDGDLGYGDALGLSGDRSEWLVAGHLGIGDELALASRALLSDTSEVTLTESRIDWDTDRFALGSSYVFAPPEPAEGRDARLSEWTFEGAYDLTDRWTASADWRYDFTADRAARAGLGLEYSNECARLALSVSRRYASSTSVEPTTEFGFRVSLLGVGGSDAERVARQSCGG